MEKQGKIYWLAVAALGATITLNQTALAAGGGDNDALSAPQAKISLGQAVATAEQQAAGRAVRAELEKVKGGQWDYDVEVVSGKKVVEVRVDPESGKVLAATEDKTDHDDGQDQED